MDLYKKDTDWIRQGFLLPRGSLDRMDATRRVYTEVSQSFTDTTFGGDTVMNPGPQYHEFCDIRPPSLSSVSKGVGRYFGESQQQTRVEMHLEFGDPEFTSMTSFFTNFYNTELGYFANTGRTNSLLYGLGKAFGLVIGIPLQIPIMIGKLCRFLMGKPSSKFYYLKSATMKYWSMVNSMCNDIAVSLGMIEPLISTGYDKTRQSIFANSDISSKTRQQLQKVLPDIFRDDGGIDMYRVATRATRLSRRHEDQIVSILEKGGTQEEMRKRFEQLMVGGIENVKGRSYQEAVEQYMATDPIRPKEGSADEAEKAGSWISEYVESGTDVEGVTAGIEESTPPGWMSSAWEELDAQLRDGARFVSFAIDPPGPTSFSSSNSLRESDLASTLNSAVSGARNARFQIADGNIGDGPLATVLEGFVGGVKSVLSGVADGVGLSGLAALSGRAFVDINKHWDVSTVNLPRVNVTLKLRSPYGNDVSRCMNLLFPMCMLLAPALPQATGNASFTSPMLVGAYSRGRFQIRTGMIDSIDIQAGQGNLPFNKDGKPLGIDITLGIVDTSSIVAIPVQPGVTPLDLLAVGGKISSTLFAEDTAYNDMMAVFGSMSLSSQIYQLPKLFRNMTKIAADFNSWMSPGARAAWVGGTLPAKVAAAFIQGTNRL